MRQDLSIVNMQGAGGQWRSIGPKVNTLLVTTYHNVLYQDVYSGLPKGHPVYGMDEKFHRTKLRESLNFTAQFCKKRFAFLTPIMLIDC